MIAAIFAALHMGDLWRREAKFSVLLAFIDFLALIIALLIITWHTREILYPPVAIIGLIWIIVTATIIWCCGGVVVDSLFAAKLLNKSVGEKFVNAFALYFFIATSAIAIHLLIPFWLFWPGYFALMLFLLGWLMSGRLSGVSFDWNKPRIAFILLSGLMVAIALFKGGYFWYSGHLLTAEIVRHFLEQPLCGIIGKLALFGVFVLIGGAILKLKFLKWTGAIILVGALACWLFTDVIKEYTGKPGPSVIMETYGPFRVPACTVIKTGVQTWGEPVEFSQASRKQYFLVGTQWNVQIDSTTWRTYWEKPGEIWLKGGPEPTEVTIKRQKLKLAAN